MNKNKTRDTPRSLVEKAVIYSSISKTVRPTRRSQRFTERQSNSEADIKNKLKNGKPLQSTSPKKAKMKDVSATPKTIIQKLLSTNDSEIEKTVRPMTKTKKHISETPASLTVNSTRPKTIPIVSEHEIPTSTKKVYTGERKDKINTNQMHGLPPRKRQRLSQINLGNIINSEIQFTPSTADFLKKLSQKMQTNNEETITDIVNEKSMVTDRKEETIKEDVKTPKIKEGLLNKELPEPVSTKPPKEINDNLAEFSTTEVVKQMGNIHFSTPTKNNNDLIDLPVLNASDVSVIKKTPNITNSKQTKIFPSHNTSKIDKDVHSAVEHSTSLKLRSFHPQEMNSETENSEDEIEPAVAGLSVASSSVNILNTSNQSKRNPNLENEDIPVKSFHKPSVYFSAKTSKPQEKTNERITKILQNYLKEPVVSYGKTKPQKKFNQPKQSKPILPCSLKQIQGMLQHHCHLKILPSAFKFAEEATEIYLNNVADRLIEISEDSGEKSIRQEHVETLMKEHKFVTDELPLRILIERHMPLEYREQLIPMVMPGNKIFPTKSVLARDHKIHSKRIKKRAKTAIP